MKFSFFFFKLSKINKNSSNAREYVEKIIEIVRIYFDPPFRVIQFIAPICELYKISTNPFILTKGSSKTQIQAQI